MGALDDDDGVFADSDGATDADSRTCAVVPVTSGGEG